MGHAGYNALIGIHNHALHFFGGFGRLIREFTHLLGRDTGA